MRKLSTLLVALFVIAACSGEGSVGDACDTEGKVDGECEDGAVCGKNKNGAVVCLKQCQSDAECAPLGCNGVSGTNIKGCR